ncbi:sensor histidine kinase [Halobellus rubicundus]|uniref:histidine kinase n=1 Tax=Halobellus rubicundus TaxID=2996466 RepID=A0ABD5MDE2_9EURY
MRVSMPIVPYLSMSLDISPRYGFYTLGSLCFLLGTQHALFEGQGLETVLESFIIWSLSLFVISTAYTLPDRDISQGGRWRALFLTVGVTVAFMILAVAVWTIWAIRGPPREFSFLVSFAGALGAVVGTRSSVYYVESTERLIKERELSKLLRINQRVLRHNIRNELSIALGYLEIVEAADDVEELPERTRIIRRHLHELLETTDRTRQIVSIWETKTLREFDLTEVVRAQITHIRADYPEVTLTTDLPETCCVRAHPKLSLAIEEAVLNAIEHNSAGVAVTVTLYEAADDSVVVEIADTGVGISEDDWKPIELPAETPLAHTEGLGLWIIYWTVQMSGGSVEFADNDPQGAIVRLVLPSQSSLLPTFAADSA